MDDAKDRLIQEATVQTPLLSLANTSTWGRVVDIVDGDTLHIVMPFLGQLFKFVVRLAGIDTCEMKSKIPENRALAVQARNRLVELCLPTNSAPSSPTRKDIQQILAAHAALVYVKCLDTDKYGRTLAYLLSEPTVSSTFNDILLHEKLAYPYEGETKLTEAQQMNALKS